MGLATVPIVLLCRVRQTSTFCVFLLASVALFLGCSKASGEERWDDIKDLLERFEKVLGHLEHLQNCFYTKEEK